jgi:hypothetical protein
MNESDESTLADTVASLRAPIRVDEVELSARLQDCCRECAVSCLIAVLALVAGSLAVVPLAALLVWQ